MKNKKFIFFGLTLFFLIGIIPFIQSQTNIDCYECLNFYDCPEGCICYDDPTTRTECGCYGRDPRTCECITPDYYCQGWNECALYEYIPRMQLPDDFICYNDQIKDADSNEGFCITYFEKIYNFGFPYQDYSPFTRTYYNNYNSTLVCCGDDVNEYPIFNPLGQESICCPNSNYVYDNGVCKWIESCADYEEFWRTITKEHAFCDYTDEDICVLDKDEDGVFDKFCLNNQIYNITIKP